MIRRIEASNFRSFRNLDIELGSFNVLVGANASGKSSFVEVLKFLRDVSRHGLLNAVSMQGGTKYLRNATIESREPLCIRVTVETPVVIPLAPRGRSRLGFSSHELVYEMTLHFNKKGPNLKSVEDHILLNGTVHRFRTRGRHVVRDSDPLDSGTVVFRRQRRQVNVELNGFATGVALSREGFARSWMTRVPLEKWSLLLEWPVLALVINPLSAQYFGSIAVFDFDPKLPKRAALITGRRTLEEDGSNLAIVIQSVIQTREGRRKLTNLVHELLPFVSDFSVEAVADRSLLFMLNETYAPTKPVPASLMSDGTINVIALILAVYFDEPRPVTVIEEPERNIHPGLISGVMEMLREGAGNRQLIITTHNPEVVRQTRVDEMLLSSRSESGFTTIVRPGDDQHVRGFLERQVGLDELFVNSLLGD